MDSEVVLQEENYLEESLEEFLLQEGASAETAVNEALENAYAYKYDRSQERKKRDKYEIGISAVRGGSIVGEHEVIFAGQDEVIELKHTAYSKAVFAKGDRRLSKVLLNAHKLGVRFDGWSDQFSQEKWDKAFEMAGAQISFYTRERSFDEVLPWDMIDIGVTKEFLISEAKKAKEGITTPNCRQKCSNCGASAFGGGVCFEKRC